MERSVSSGLPPPSPRGRLPVTTNRRRLTRVSTVIINPIRAARAENKARRGVRIVGYSLVRVEGVVWVRLDTGEGGGSGVRLVRVKVRSVGYSLYV